MSAVGIEPLLHVAPARAVELLSGAREAPTAAAVLRSLDLPAPAPGPAWRDMEFLAELRAEHERLGASSASRASIDALADGAACVVTGQQPGLLVGPLYTFYKILGTIALARELSRRQGRPFVPVYWCGSDDADFDEVRTAWMWDPTEGAFRAEAPRDLWRPGQRVGDVRSASLATIEAATLRRAGAPEPWREIAAALDGLDGWGDRARAWVLRMFADEGIVVVDARSPRLRALGAPWFEDYARHHDEITRALDAHSEALAAQLWSTPIDAVARRSGLFALEDGVRRKLDPRDLGAATFDPTQCAPSVLLRPVWQDALLGPEVAVLGPSEMQYHGQLRPLYESLGVRAARPAFRPHAVVVDAHTWPHDARAREMLLDGHDDALAALRRGRLPRSWSAALDAVDAAARDAVEGLDDVVEDDAARREVARLRTGLRRHVERARDRLADRVGDDLSAPARAQWYNLRGRPQERAFATPAWGTWWGTHDVRARTVLAEAFVRSIDTGFPPGWALTPEE